MSRDQSFCLSILALCLLSFPGMSGAGGSSRTYLPLILRPLEPCKISSNEATRPGARGSYSFDQILSCLNTAGKILVLDNGWIEGTFNTLAEIAQHYIAKGSMTPGGTLKTIRASAITQTVMDWDILALPWTVHSY
jgi:hypothetical protein